jgi:hypothetical protein
MQKSWRVTLDIDDDLYSAWRDYLIKIGVRAAGMGAAIRRTNSKIFSDAIRDKMEKK